MAANRARRRSWLRRGVSFAIAGVILLWLGGVLLFAAQLPQRPL